MCVLIGEDFIVDTQVFSHAELVKVVSNEQEDITKSGGLFSIKLAYTNKYDRDIFTGKKSECSSFLLEMAENWDQPHSIEIPKPGVFSLEEADDAFYRIATTVNFVLYKMDGKNVLLLEADILSNPQPDTLRQTLFLGIGTDEAKEFMLDYMRTIMVAIDPVTEQDTDVFIKSEVMFSYLCRYMKGDIDLDEFHRLLEYEDQEQETEEDTAHE